MDNQNWIAPYQTAPMPGSDIPWLAALRAQAHEFFIHHGLPSRHDEDWKYSSLAQYANQPMPPAPAPTTVNSTLPADLAWADCARLVFVDGHWQPQLSHWPQLPDGTILLPLAQALQQCPEWLAPHIQAPTNAMEALNLAGFYDGVFLHLPAHASLGQPLHLLFLATSRAGFAAHPRSVIVAGEHSQLELIEHYSDWPEQPTKPNTTPGPWVNAVLELHAGAGSQITHYRIQESRASVQAAHLALYQQQDSRLISHALLLGNGPHLRNSIHCRLDGTGAQCELYGLSALDGTSRADSHTRIEHNHPHCTSRQFYKAVAADHAKAIFTGRVVVQPDACQTVARQTSHNLLLSRQAEANARPQLEILASDVQCSHGATVGQLDETALFYLQSRGIPRAAASDLLVYGFAEEILDLITQPTLRARLQTCMLRHLPQSAAFFKGIEKERAATAECVAIVP